MEPQLSLRRLEIFRLIVEEHSVTRAAERLGIAQPAVSSQLRSLEEWVGAKLFFRHGNRLTLTEAGERVNSWAKGLLAGATELRRDVEGIESGQMGSAVATASMGVGSYLLPGVLTRFRAGHPGADLTLNVVQPHESLRQIATGEADFAVTSWDSDDVRTDITSSFLRDEPMVIVVRSDAQSADRPMTLDEALRLPLVGAPRGVAAQRSMTSQLRRLTDQEPRFIVRLGHASSAKQAVMDHNWAAILPKYVVAAEVAAGVLGIVDVPGLDIREHLVLAWRHDKIFSRLHQRLISEIRRELGDSPAGRTGG